MASINWDAFWQAQQSIEEAREAEGSRLTDRVEFVISAGGENYEFDLEDLRNPAEATVNGAPVFDPDTAELFTELGTKDPWADLGRGADTVGWALSIAAIVISAPGAIAGWKQAANKAAGLWKKLRGRGFEPVMSLGTVKLLAYLDLMQRRELSENATLVLAADANGMNHLVYSPDDVFILIFQDGAVIFIYLVDSTGRVLYTSTGPIAGSTIPNEYEANATMGGDGGASSRTFPSRIAALRRPELGNRG